MGMFNEIREAKIPHLIGGRAQTFADETYFDNITPIDGSVINQVIAGGQTAVDAAVSAAHSGLTKSGWAHWPVEKRSQCLIRMADLILENLPDLAKLETLDTGKPIQETTHGDILRSASNFRFFAELALQSAHKTYQSSDGSVHTTKREPIGIVGLITPWNLPMYLESWKAAPALVTGNAVILKPAELTPMTGYALGLIAREAGVPGGIFNVIQGFGPNAIGSALVNHPDVRAISFTGETSTGAAIAASSAPMLKKLSFELGGKGASVVFADADLDQAAKTVVKAAFRNQGQICLAGSRLIVEKSVSEKFVAKVLAHIKEIKVGDPFDDQTTMGAVISAEHKAKVMSFINYALENSYKVVCGGKETLGMEGGAFIDPTLIVDVPQSSKLIQEEVFGPVLTTQTFETCDEAIALLNGTKYGLSCSVWTSNMQTMAKVSNEARMGLVWQNAWFLRNLNTAFGGMKSSGVGREGGAYSLDFFSELKTISTPNYN